MKRRQFNQHLGQFTIASAFLPLIACRNEPIEVVNLDLEELTITGARTLIDSGKITISRLTELYLDRIQAIDRSGPELNSIICTNPDAMAIAAKLDEELKNGTIRSALHGIPVILKDNINTGDKMPTTAGSRALKGSIVPSDAVVAKKLREAGAVIIGKANLSEWANFRGQKSTSGWSGLGGLTKNPYILDRNTCGSSAGSGAAVSANLCMIAIGTETNGSIVCPSSTNGVVGIKPTVGLVSRTGIIPISSTQDTAGPMARTVADAAIAMGALIGVDPLDIKTNGTDDLYSKDYSIFLNKNGLEGKKIGHFTSNRGIMQEVDTLMEEAIAKMSEMGAEIVEIDHISEDHVSEDSFNIMLYEYKDGLNKYFASLGPDAPIKSVEDLIEFNKRDSVELQYFGQEYLEMALAKGDLDSEDYKETLARMLKGRRQLGIDRVMDDNGLNAIIAPTGSPAWKTDLENGDTFKMGSSSPAAQAGYPNITVPMGFVDRLPVGISIFGRAWSEPVLIEIAYAYEQATLHRRKPEFLKE
jgi:amidase